MALTIKHGKNSQYPIEKKIEAVSTFLVLGNLAHTAASVGVSLSLVKQWKAQPWWKDLELEIAASKRIAASAKLGAIVEKSLDVIDDRLSNGDFVYDGKSGEVVRKPVSMRDAGNVANSLMQRQAIIEKLTRDETVVETTVSIQEQLKGLAAEFAKFNNRHKTQAIDVAYEEITDAVYDEGAAQSEDARDQSSGIFEESRETNTSIST
jgi:hypothetical protein